MNRMIHKLNQRVEHKTNINDENLYEFVEIAEK